MSEYQDNTWFDELLAEAEKNEENQSIAYFDLCILKIGELKDQIVHNFQEADKEKEIITNWALQENSKIQNKIDYLEHKLEAWLRELNLRTKSLPHGVIKIRKTPDKIEIHDLQAFLKAADRSMLRIIPEEHKPDLNMIRNHVKRTGKIPPGISLLQGLDKFSLIINKNS